jgi:asparaginyl-tRNA synthetase
VRTLSALILRTQGQPLQMEHERFLAEEVVQGPVFVTDYPRDIKPFYMRLNDDCHGCVCRGAWSPKRIGALTVAGWATVAPPQKRPMPTVAATDLLVPYIGELAGGSMREERLPELLVRPFGPKHQRGAADELLLQAQLDRCHLSATDLAWYVDLRRFGTVPHGGFGMGFERLMLLLTGMDNVRDVVPFPRTVGHCQY